MPQISLKLNKLEGNAAHDIMGAISNNLFKDFQACSSALSAENARVAYLSAALANEKVYLPATLPASVCRPALFSCSIQHSHLVGQKVHVFVTHSFRINRMQEQLDTAMFSGKRKQHAVLPLPDLPPTQIPSGEKLPLRNTHYHILNLGFQKLAKLRKWSASQKNWVLEFMLLLQQEEGGEWELSFPEEKMMMTRNDCQVPETYHIKDIDIYDNLQFCVVIISSIA